MTGTLVVVGGHFELRYDLQDEETNPDFSVCVRARHGMPRTDRPSCE
ncbi:MAG: hypothetical protein AAGD10_06630 [Myxococcota bacterium]